MYKGCSDIDGLAQDYSISFANALEVLQSCTKPSTYVRVSNVFSDISYCSWEWHLHHWFCCALKLPYQLFHHTEAEMESFDDYFHGSVQDCSNSMSIGVTAVLH